MWESFFFILMLNGNLVIKDTFSMAVVPQEIVEKCAKTAQIEDYRDRLEYSDPTKELTMLDCIYAHTGVY